MDTATFSKTEILDQLQACRRASRKLIQLSDGQINQILHELADLAIQEADHLLAENKKDLERMDPADPKYDRLLLSPERLAGIAADLREVASLPSPLGEVLDQRNLDNGLNLKKVRVPIGVIGLVFESRPNVTFDVFSLCLKSGNVAVLKGSRDAHYSNLAIVSLIHRVLAKYDLEDACYLAPSAREALGVILGARSSIDLLIPRGGRGLIDYVRKNATMPVVETGAGVVHTYYSPSADLVKGKEVIENAKARRVSVCNALDTLLIHRERLADLPDLLARLGEIHQCRVWADEQAYGVLQGNYPAELLEPAQADSFGREFLSMQMSVKTVEGLEEAIEHVNEYSSQHSEAILSEDPAEIETYLQRIDAAVVYANTSTAFTDGAQFGLGAEIGISTQKLHARGPMGLQELTSYKWVVRGDGQVRPR